MLSKEKIKQIRKLHDKKWRTESGLFLVEGRKMILELFASDWKERIVELYINDKLFEEIVASFPWKGREFKRELCVWDTEAISKISTLENNTDGVVVARKLQPLSLFERERIQDRDNSWTLVLDGIRDPGNMGTILRTAAWFWVQNIICSEDSVELYNSKVISATMGAVFHLDIYYENLENFYKNNILPVYATELRWKNFWEIVFPKSWILVMGSESHGISEISKKYMTESVCIKKLWYGESLNVWIASWILLSYISQS